MKNNQLTALHKEQLDAVLKEHGLYKMINEYLNANGLQELEVRLIKVRPKRNSFETVTAAVPTCPHGYPMVETCTLNGDCTWVCDHG